jgi:hypothetical protein
MGRGILGVITGLLMWFLVATVGNMLLRFAIPGYAQAEPPMNFTIAMMAARLVLGGVSSLFAGYAAAWISNANRYATLVLGILLVVLFVPVHYGLWDKFPLWYHLTFLLTLLPLTYLGAQMKTSSIQSPPAG